MRYISSHVYESYNTISCIYNNEMLNNKFKFVKNRQVQAKQDLNIHLTT